MDAEFLEKVKRLTIAALVADDILMGILVLKGGNALNLAYEISSRGSIDIDFSMERDFTEREKGMLRNQIDSLLNSEFNRAGLRVVDAKLLDRPKGIDETVKNFWGGYTLEFKLIEQEKYDALQGDPELVRRNTISLHGNNSPVFCVDISKYEYVASKRPKEINGSVVYVYTPEMLALEKLRALCQQVREYRKVVKRMTSKSRARDFYDIHNLLTSFRLDFSSKENVQLAEHIFSAKRVPLAYVGKLEEYREWHRQSWPAVLQTIHQGEQVAEFDFYFDFVLERFAHLSP